MSFAN